MNYEDTCLHWGEDGCQAYVADVEPDETKLQSPSPWSNHYTGIYAKKYNLEEPA